MVYQCYFFFQRKVKSDGIIVTEDTVILVCGFNIFSIASEHAKTPILFVCLFFNLTDNYYDPFPITTEKWL